MGVEIVLSWGSTLLDVVRADEFSLSGTPLVGGGQALVAPIGAVGPVAYELRTASAVDALPPPRADRRLGPYVIALGIMHVAVVMSALALPLTTSRAPATHPQSTLRARIAAAPEMRGQGADDRGHADQGQARAMIGARAAAGAARTTPTGGHIAIANTGELPQLTRAEAIERARHAGILGSDRVSADALASLVGRDSITSGFDARMAEAALADTSGTDAGFGGTLDGIGNGGGGDGGTIGRGRIGEHSDGTSFGHGWGGRASTVIGTTWSGGSYDYTPMPHHLRVRRPSIAICDGVLRAKCRVEGALDPAVVRRYIKRRSAQLSFCFERYAIAHPGPLDEPLELELDVDAQVLAVTATGVPGEVANCAADAIRAIEFPPGATHVLYYIAKIP